MGFSARLFRNQQKRHRPFATHPGGNIGINEARTRSPSGGRKGFSRDDDGCVGIRRGGDAKIGSCRAFGCGRTARSRACPAPECAGPALVRALPPRQPYCFDRIRAGRPAGARQPYVVLANRNRYLPAGHRPCRSRSQCPLVGLRPPASAAAGLGAGAAFAWTFDTAITHAAHRGHEDFGPVPRHCERLSFGPNPSVGRHAVAGLPAICRRADGLDARLRRSAFLAAYEAMVSRGGRPWGRSAC